MERGKVTTAAIRLCLLALASMALAGCGPDERLQRYAGTYVLDKDYYVVTLELAPDGEYGFEKRWTEEDHPMVREAYRGRVETQEGRWSVGRDRTDMQGDVVLLTPSPPNITRMPVNEEGNLVEFVSDDVYVRQ